jgi:hypothetical protein
MPTTTAYKDAHRELNDNKKGIWDDLRLGGFLHDGSDDQSEMDGNQLPTLQNGHQFRVILHNYKTITMNKDYTSM